MDVADKPARVRSRVRAGARGGRRRAGDQADRAPRGDARTGAHRSPVEGAVARADDVRGECNFGYLVILVIWLFLVIGYLTPNSLFVLG